MEKALAYVYSRHFCARALRLFKADSILRGLMKEYEEYEEYASRTALRWLRTPASDLR